MPALCVVLNIVLFVGNYKLHESNVAMHEENVAFYEQNVATQDAFEHRYDKYETTITDYTGLEEYPLKAEQHTQDMKDFADWVVRTGQAFNWIPTKFRNIW